MLKSLQTGFSLVPALFLLVVLATLGSVAVRMNEVQQQTVVLTMQGTRAFSAAQAGIDWAAYEAVVNGSCGNGSMTFNEAGLNGFSVNTSCSSSSHTVGQSTVNVYTIEAFAWSGAYGQPDYISRRLTATVSDSS